jgi:(p)ppGpp synthase/HD superfamily hydrolase
MNERLASKAEKFAKRVHAETGCTYDGMPFDKHLDSVHSVFNRYKGFLHEKWGASFNYIDVLDKIECAIWLHDVMEDCRVSYGELVREFNVEIAEIVYALTNEIARSRSEMSDLTYPKIRALGAAAIFVKLCDRISNTEASINHPDGYHGMYKREFPKFKKHLRTDDWGQMWSDLEKITNS